MKKIMVILLVIMLVCSLLSACSGAPAASPALNSSAPSQPIKSDNTPERPSASESDTQDQPTQSNTPGLPSTPDGAADGLAQQFLDSLENCPYVEDENNRIGFDIDRIEKDGDDYVVYWTSTNAAIAKNPSNVAYAFSLITFYNPEDYSNSYQGFTMENGQMNVDFAAGESISYDHVRVKLPTASKVVYMFFAGAENGPEELYTVPLFYTLILDDNPHVFESAPRAANGLFSE
ncbi:MAG: hypothetical protein LBN26_10000 [Christensenellaceae bacterium]|nr:hypothetical protein [Christensenellaceae bacterium]